MVKMRWGIVLVAAALIESPPSAADPTVGSYTVVIDVSKDPVGVQHWKFLDQSKIVALCGDQDGCTFQVKIDGPGGKANKAETIHLIRDSLEFTSTTTLDPPPPPKVDADGRNRYLVYARRQTGASGDLAACDITDQDDNTGHRDSTVGFSMSFIATGPSVGATACALEVQDAPAPPASPE